MLRSKFLGSKDTKLVDWLLPGLALLLVALLVGCGSDDDNHGGQSTIRLAQNAWLGSELNATVAQILLEEELGFSVELVEIDEDAQWDLIAAGDLDASLEVWPSGQVGS